MLDSAEGSMGMWGSGNEKARWSGMSEKEKLMHSVGVKKLFSVGLEQKLKSHAAKLWVDGFVMFVSRLEKENCDFKDRAKECAHGLRG